MFSMFNEPRLGWRFFTVNGEGELGSITRPVTWPANEAMQAQCDLHVGRMQIGCTCGLYGGWDLRQLKKVFLLPGATAVAQTKFWGLLVEGKKGLRAEFGYPAIVYVQDAALAEKISKRYSVPCLSGEAWGALAEEIRGKSPQAKEKENRELLLARRRDRFLAAAHGPWQRRFVTALLALDRACPWEDMAKGSTSTPARLGSLADVLERLAQMGVRITRQAGPRGGEHSAVYSIISIEKNSVDAVGPQLRGDIDWKSRLLRRRASRRAS